MDRGGPIGRFLLVGGASVLLAHVVGLGSGTASQMLLARLLTPEHLAAYFLTLSVVEVTSHLANLGLPRPLTRLLAQACARGRRDEARGSLAAALPLWLGSSFLVIVVYVSGPGDWLARSVFDSEVMATGTAVAAFWIVLHASGGVLAGALRGFRRIGLAAWVESSLARVALATVLLLLFLRSGSADFWSVLVIATLAALLGPLVAAFSLGREVAGVESHRGSAKTLLGAGLPLLVTGVVYMANQRVDLWAVGASFPDQVAVYGAVKRLIVLISLPLVILNLSVPPIVAELHAQQDLERLQRALRGAATLAGVPAILMLVVFALFSETVLGLAFGDFFREGALVLTVLSVERLVFVWVGPAGMVLAMTGNEKALLRISLGGAVLTVTAVVAGGQLYGFLGVAAGFVVGSSAEQLAMWYSARTRVGVRTDVDLLHLGPALDALRRAMRR